MKKIALFTLLALLLGALSISAFAADSSDKDDLLNLTLQPEYDLSDLRMNVIDFSYQVEPDNDNGIYEGNIGAGDYVYLKAPDGMPASVTVTFYADTEGEYQFAVCLMSYLYDDGRAQPPRTGLVQVDDGDKYYIGANHTTHLQDEWYVGMTEYLTEGEHTFTIYLASDFDDSTVKSAYFKSFSYINPKAPEVTLAPDTDPEESDPIQETEGEGSDETGETDDVTKAPADDDVTAGDDKTTEKPKDEDKGCGSLIAGAMIPVLLGVAIVLHKNKP